MGKAYNEEIDFENDPLADVKYKCFESLRYMGNQTSNLKEKMYFKIYFSLSLIFAIFIAIFAKSLNWLMVGVLINMLLVILVLFAWLFYKERCENEKIILNILSDLKRLGVDIKR